MHELSVALSLIEGIDDAARREGFDRVLSVRVRVGALSGIAPDALRFSWKLAAAGTLAADSALEIENVPLAVWCDACAGERTPSAAHGLVCPECGNVAPTVVRGRELQLVAVEVPE
ncbi:MAG TPA: hydrogenase maturation nickel metallochaperone HypA [Candidatus Elarobacter sp.]|jgi:hydrogenase nickel incorporation protein HypA/HybF|nr:hydrogenase maturation nickel metallochaperone HypA [Candidatus Elarobacter sp.]